MSSEPAALWRRIDVAAVVVGNLTGLLVILAAWAGAGHEVVPDRQVGWVELGIAGLLIITVANTGWLLAGRRACWRLRHLILPAERGLPWPGSGDPSTNEEGEATALVASAAMTWYHAAGCPMVAGKTVAEATDLQHRAAGRRPCAVCRPPA